MAPAPLFTKALAVLALAAAWLAGGAQPAHAQAAPGGWSICNQSSYIVEAAHVRPVNRKNLVRGWIRMRPGECWTAVTAPLTRASYFLYARTAISHRGGRLFWAGDRPYCVDASNPFSFENPADCRAQGLSSVLFREVRISKRESWRTNLREAENYSLPEAKTAGLQRLLLDAGLVSQGRVGQIDARRVAGAIAKFRADSRLPANATYEQLVDALEQAARRHAAKVGLTLCNRAKSGQVWAAIARRLGEAWESRGWWRLGPNGCVRAIDEPLQQKVYFVHAVLTTDKGDRYLKAPGEVFCSSPAKFAVIDRDRCEARFYDETLFTAISPQGKQGLVVEFREEEFLPVGELPQKTDKASLAERASRDSAPPNPEQDKGQPGRTPPASAQTRP